MGIENTLITLAEFHFAFGYIGLNEYQERINVASWLAGGSDKNGDPRIQQDSKEGSSEKENLECAKEAEVFTTSTSGQISDGNDKDLIELVCLGKWVFTKADPDSYPSVPHGHYNSRNRQWPKLNPYTGRVFDLKHKENTSLRLSKPEMSEIWNDEKFKSFCREMIIWYQEQFPHYRFPVQWPLRFPKW